jgi:chromosome segregation ATPase
MQSQRCGIKMHQESDHPNSDESGAAAAKNVGSDVSQLEERVRVLVTEKDRLAADLAQAKSAVEASEHELASSGQKIQELTAERDRLIASQRQSQSAVEASERQLAAVTGRVRQLAKEQDELQADMTRMQEEANKVRDTLRARDSESFFGFIRRRYFGQN